MGKGKSKGRGKRKGRRRRKKEEEKVKGILMKRVINTGRGMGDYVCK